MAEDDVAALCSAISSAIIFIQYSFYSLEFIRILTLVSKRHATQVGVSTAVVQSLLLHLSAVRALKDLIYVTNTNCLPQQCSPLSPW